MYRLLLLHNIIIKKIFYLVVGGLTCWPTWPWPPSSVVRSCTWACALQTGTGTAWTVGRPWAPAPGSGPDPSPGHPVVHRRRCNRVAASHAPVAPPTPRRRGPRVDRTIPDAAKRWNWVFPCGAGAVYACVSPVPMPLVAAARQINKALGCGAYVHLAPSPRQPHIGRLCSWWTI